MSTTQVVTRGEYERELETLDSASLAVVSRQEIDAQIATAHKFPRSIIKFRDEVASLATLNEKIAAECSYAKPCDGKVIEGASIRFAEILFSAWGNARAASRIVSDDGMFITAQGAFHDLQKNTGLAFEVRRRVTSKVGRRFSDDMVATTGNAASSIALRNAILKCIPQALWLDLWEQARHVAKGDHKTLANRRAEALKMFQGYGVDQEQLLIFLQVSGIEEITTDHLLTLRGLVTSFKEGDTTPEEVFARAAPQENVIKSPTQKLNEFANGGKSKSSSPPVANSGGEEGEEDRGVAHSASEESASDADNHPDPSRADADSAKPMPPALKDAYERGRAARQSKYGRELPKTFKGAAKKDEAEAFLRGWDDEDAESAAEEHGSV